jgi:hypothetical protein
MVEQLADFFGLFSWNMNIHQLRLRGVFAGYLCLLIDLIKCQWLFRHDLRQVAKWFGIPGLWGKINGSV